jgi:hypothetical protein
VPGVCAIGYYAIGYRFVRLDAELVLRDLPAAVALIRAAL